jgi:hypothetical protein
MSAQQRQIITRLIKNAETPLKKLGKWPSGDEGEEHQFGLDCKDCGIIYINLNLMCDSFFAACFQRLTDAILTN